MAFIFFYYTLSDKYLLDILHEELLCSVDIKGIVLKFCSVINMIESCFKVYSEVMKLVHEGF